MTRRRDVDRSVFKDYCRQQYDTLHGDTKPHRAEADALSWANVFVKCWTEINTERWSLAKLLGF